jgi:hypothetical protein
MLSCGTAYIQLSFEFRGGQSFSVLIWRGFVGMASRFAGPPEALKMDPEVEREVEVKTINTIAAQEVDFKPMEQGMEEYIVLEEDPEMYSAAGLEFMPMPSPIVPDQQGLIEASIKQAMAAVPDVKGATVNLKIVVC